MSLLEISGPEFLVWYMAFFALSGLVAFVLRCAILQVSRDAIADGNIDEYDVAYLSGGSQQVYYAALGTLVRIGLVTLDAASRKLTVKDHDKKSLHPIEADLCATIKYGRNSTVYIAYRQFLPSVGRIERRLQEFKLVPSDMRTQAAQIIPTLVLLVVPTFIGLPRLINGTALHHPTLFLLGFLGFSLVVAGLALFNKPYRTSLGAEAVSILQGKHEALKTNFRSCPSSLSSNDMTLAYALFGGDLFSATDPFNMARAAMHPVSTGGGSGCGSSGCGGGGGCGGGCGGCGGCGG